jgi:hypothetical protein
MFTLQHALGADVGVTLAAFPGLEVRGNWAALWSMLGFAAAAAGRPAAMSLGVPPPGGEGCSWGRRDRRHQRLTHRSAPAARLVVQELAITEASQEHVHVDEAAFVLLKGGTLRTLRVASSDHAFIGLFAVRSASNFPFPPLKPTPNSAPTLPSSEHMLKKSGIASPSPERPPRPRIVLGHSGTRIKSGYNQANLLRASGTRLL